MCEQLQRLCKLNLAQRLNMAAYCRKSNGRSGAIKKRYESKHHGLLAEICRVYDAMQSQVAGVVRASMVAALSGRTKAVLHWKYGESQHE